MAGRNIEKFNLADLEEEDFDTVLANDIEFSGSVEFSQPLMIRGKVSGKIKSNSDLVIEPEASVYADILADRIIIKGEVVGDVQATTEVLVYSSGKLTGDVTAPEVILEPGCFFSGICTMTKN